MKTADFLPEAAFEGHLDRRKTPLRLLWLGGLAFLCSFVSGAFALEAARVERQAVTAEEPDEEARQARSELDLLYAEMQAVAPQLDPLSEHLKRPTVGWILRDIAKEIGDGVQIEEVRWDFSFGVPRAKNGVDRDKVALTLVATVLGKQALLELDDRLQDFTGFSEVVPRRQEVVPGREGAVRFELTLSERLDPRTSLPGAQQ